MTAASRKFTAKSSASLAKRRSKNSPTASSSQSSSSSKDSSSLLTNANKKTTSSSQQQQQQLQTKPKYLVQNIQHNRLIIYKCKVFISLLFGIYTGICGLEAFQGFAVFALVFLVSSFLIKSMAGLRKGYHLDSEISELWMNGLSDSLLTFVLFWTLSYNGKFLFKA